MFVILGATGNTGRAAVDALRQAGQPVRAVVRRPNAEAALRQAGAETAVADVTDRAALTKAFEGAEAVYLMNPPAYMDADLFARAHEAQAAMIAAAQAAGVGRVVALSSVGAQHSAGTGNILTAHDFEQQLEAYKAPLTILRAASFMENWASVLPVAKQHGILPSMLQPLDRKLPMQAAADIGRSAAALMQEGGADRRIVELHGPADYSPIDAAAALSEILDRPVQAVAPPESEWPGVFRNQGMPEISVQAFCEMMRGFNNGHCRFEGTHETIRGKTTLKDALADIAKA